MVRARKIFQSRLWICLMLLRDQPGQQTLEDAGYLINALSLRKQLSLLLINSIHFQTFKYTTTR